MFKRLFCKHEFEWKRNIYGDQINYAGGKRSLWQCSKCEAGQFRGPLEVAKESIRVKTQSEIFGQWISA